MLRNLQVKELRPRRQTKLIDFEQKFSRTAKTLINVVALVQVGIVDEALPTHAGSRLFKISAHHDDQLVRQALGDRGQLLRIFQNRNRIVNRAGPDNNNQARVASVENIGDRVARFIHNL